MVERATTLCLSLTALLLVAGCTAGMERPIVYETVWRYGPQMGDKDEAGNPFLRERFQARVGGLWVLNVTHDAIVGAFELRLRGPDGQPQAIVRGNATEEFVGRPGTWAVEIDTSAPNHEMPRGRVQVRVNAYR
jgi:hypothetical protein